MSMDMERLERAWTGAANRADAAAGLYLIDSALAAVARRQRDFRLRMGLIGVVLTGWSLVVVYGIVWRGNVDLLREWAALLMLAITWTVYAAILRRGEGGMPEGPAPSLPAGLRALLSQTEGAMRRIRVMAVAVPIFLLALGLAVTQLGQVGKMSSSHMRDFALLAGIGFSLSGGIFTFRYHRILKPEAERLRRLLGQYEEQT
ncbi:hypothetical protein CHU95_07455 [Niveispirillum lacus]|uniref:Uncharacterized protein n=1 Tax=Niveispirillum lacus TaxID=1981099 RepID=A0A255Z3Q2_9PROT|nr:hypothetical protein [Niveispirillum lacus]OYQ35554.1 hypothetical protein CHU95_07455 [Niveispirillum lacus]